MKKHCCDKKHKNKGAWTKEEDAKLVDYMTTHGEGCWRTLPKQAGLHRCGKSCRMRWMNYLRPDIKPGKFAQDEADLIVKLHALLGNRWSLIAGRLPGRTDNEVKNYWNSHLRRKLISMGIDPKNHRLHQTQTIHHPRDEDENKKPYQSTSSVPSKALVEPVCDADEQQVSDATSASRLHDEMEERSCSYELNLDLTIGLPSSSQYIYPSMHSGTKARKQASRT